MRGGFTLFHRVGFFFFFLNPTSKGFHWTFSSPRTSLSSTSLVLFYSTYECWNYSLKSVSGAFHTHLHHHPPGGGGQLQPGLPLVRRLAVFRDGGYGHRDGSVSVPGLQRSQAAVGGVGVSWHVPFGRRRLHLLPALPLGACSHEAFLPAERVQQHRVTLLLRLLAVLALLVTAELRRLLRAASRSFPRARGQRQHRPHDDNRTTRRESLRSRWGGSVFPCVCPLRPLERYKQKQTKREEKEEEEAAAGEADM